MTTKPATIKPSTPANNAIAMNKDNAKAVVTTKTTAVAAAKTTAVTAAKTVATDNAKTKDKPTPTVKRKSTKMSSPLKRVNDVPILIILIMVWIIVFICYLLFQKGLNSTIISSFNIPVFVDYLIPQSYSSTDFTTWNSTTNLNILKNLRFGKFLLFILIFLFITLFTLFIVYNLLLEGNTANNPKVYGIICSCFFSIVLTTFALLEFVPYLVDIFENTLGYLYIITTRTIDTSFFNNNCIGKESLPENLLPDENNVSYQFLITIMSLFNMNHFIKQLCDNNQQPNPDTSNESNQENNPELKFFINFNNTNNDVTDNGVAPTTESKIKRLIHLVFLKHSVGHFVWIYFASLICVFTSIKGFSQYIN
jgi:hypothetical protein